MEILDPLEKKSLDYATFRTHIREALNASIRVSKQHSVVGAYAEKLSMFVAGANFVYVIITSQLSQTFDMGDFLFGSLITIFSLIELGIRFNPMKARYNPLARFNPMFDGLALVGVLVSCNGKCGVLWMEETELI